MCRTCHVTTYEIRRFYFAGGYGVIDTGLTLEEAQAHCQRDDTRKEGEWFDGYAAESPDAYPVANL